MALSTRELRRKIKSVQSTKQLTSAMQMVAASKMQRAIDNNQKTREYSRLAWEIVRDLALRIESISHPLLAERKIERSALILLTSNRGLCGSFNTQIIKKATECIKENPNADLITVGTKGRNFMQRFYSKKIVADFPLSEKVIEFKEVSPIAKIVLDDFTAKKYDKITIVYNHFISKIKQEPTLRQILPIPKFSEKIGEKMFDSSENKEVTAKNQEYLFEPNMHEVLSIMLPKIIETQLFQIVLESNASEQSARMIAMKNASDNASDLISDLQLTYNTIRQAAITSEIAEISAGAEALRS